MRVVVCEKFAGSSPAKLLEFFCELPGDAKVAVQHDVDARAKGFGQTVGGFKEDSSFVAFGCCPQLAFALSTFDREKSAKAKVLRRESRTDECDQNR